MNALVYELEKKGQSSMSWKLKKMNIAVESPTETRNIRWNVFYISPDKHWGPSIFYVPLKEAEGVMFKAQSCLMGKTGVQGHGDGQKVAWNTARMDSPAEKKTVASTKRQDNIASANQNRFGVKCYNNNMNCYHNNFINKWPCHHNDSD